MEFAAVLLILSSIRNGRLELDC